MTSQFAEMTESSIFFDVAVFLLSCLVAGPSFMSISWLVLELWQFVFIRDWPEGIYQGLTRIPLSGFCPRSEGWCELGIPNLARMSVVKSNWMPQNAIATAFLVSELSRENQQGGGKISPTPTQMRVKS